MARFEGNENVLYLKATYCFYFYFFLLLYFHATTMLILVGELFQDHMSKAGDVCFAEVSSDREGCNITT